MLLQGSFTLAQALERADLSAAVIAKLRPPRAMITHGIRGIVKARPQRRAGAASRSKPEQSNPFLSMMKWCDRIALTPRAAAQSKKRDTQMKKAMAKLHGQSPESSGPPQTIESVWGRIIAQSTAQVSQWSTQYREKASLFDKLTQRSHDMMRALVIERREQLAKQRAAVSQQQAGVAANLMASLASSSRLEVDSSDADGRVLNAHFTQKKIQRIGLQLESLFGSANARLKDKAMADKAKAERQQRQQSRLSKMREKKIAGGAARQMQKLFRRRKARQMYEHLKHLETSAHDIPIINTRPFKLSTMSFEAVSGQGSSASNKSLQHPTQSVTSDADRARQGLREFLLHKCVSGDVEHVREELSLFSLHLSSDSDGEDLNSGDVSASNGAESKDTDHFDYFDQELMRQVLAIAAKSGHASIVDLIVSSLHFDPRIVLDPRSQSTAILYASEHGHANVISYLGTARLPDESQIPAVWQTPDPSLDPSQDILDARVKCGSVQVVHERLSPHLYEGHSALHLAVQGSHLEAVKTLLSLKASPDVVSFLPVKFSRTQGEYQIVDNLHDDDTASVSLMAVSPLSIACSNIIATQSHVQRKTAHAIFDLLLAAKASVHICSLPSHLLELNRVAQLAASTGNDPGVSTGSANSTNSQGRFSTSSSTCSQGAESDSADEKGFDDSHRENAPVPEVEIVNQSPLFYAVKNFRVSLVRKLLDAGADPDSVVEFRESAGMFGGSKSPKSGSSKNRRNRPRTCRLPLTHFAAASFNPNSTSSLGPADLESGFTTLSQQVIATVDLLLERSSFAEHCRDQAAKEGLVEVRADTVSDTQTDEAVRQAAGLSPASTPHASKRKVVSSARDTASDRKTAAARLVR